MRDRERESGASPIWHYLALVAACALLSAIVTGPVFTQRLRHVPWLAYSVAREAFLDGPKRAETERYNRANLDRLHRERQAAPRRSP